GTEKVKRCTLDRQSTSDMYSLSSSSRRKRMMAQRLPRTLVACSFVAHGSTMRILVRSLWKSRTPHGFSAMTWQVLDWVPTLYVLVDSTLVLVSSDSLCPAMPS